MTDNLYRCEICDELTCDQDTELGHLMPCESCRTAVEDLCCDWDIDWDRQAVSA